MSDEKKRDDYPVDMADRKEARMSSPLRVPPPRHTVHYTVGDNPMVAVISYCGSSILMTVTNKYVLSGTGFNLSFFLLAVQVCPLPCCNSSCPC